MGFNTVAIGRARDKEEELVKNLGARQYIDNRSQNAVEELNKLGGAKVILARIFATYGMIICLVSLV
jgi:D-arabinose 1-dehydrogenase-like Zn-dependent alcohol dehydrogenase